MVGAFYILPKTQLPLRIPIDFYYHNPGEFTPETGFKPDIYVDNLNVEVLIEYLNNLGEEHAQ